MTAPRKTTHRFLIQPGTLYLCPTPLGNLGDITLRTLEVLEQSDLVAAEDTRRTLKLLTHFQIKKSLISYHAHNRHSRESVILDHLRQGQAVALVTDAGMPGISDPGADLVQACLREHLPFEVLPGPSAVLLALAASGLSTERFVFEGFLPRDKKYRRKRLEALRQEERTLIFYEAPHRIKSTLASLEEHLGDRLAALGRELTKRHETWYRETLSGIRKRMETAEGERRGEMVLVVAGRDPEETEAAAAAVWKHMSLEDHVAHVMAQGMDRKTAIKEVARLRGLPKREVYNQTLEK